MLNWTLAEESRADEIHYPGTYLAGGYNRLQTDMAGRTIENEDLVNLPNWLCLTFRVEDAEWFDLTMVDVLSYHQELDLKHGILSRTLRFRDKQRRVTALASRRFVPLAAIEKNLTGTAIAINMAI